MAPNKKQKKKKQKQPKEAAKKPKIKAAIQSAVHYHQNYLALLA